MPCTQSLSFALPSFGLAFSLDFHSNDMTCFHPFFQMYTVPIPMVICIVKSQPTIRKVRFNLMPPIYTTLSNLNRCFRTVRKIQGKNSIRNERERARKRERKSTVIISAEATEHGNQAQVQVEKNVYFGILKHIRRTCYIMFDATHSLNTHTHIRHASYNIAHQTFCAIVRQNGRQRLPSVYDLCNVFSSLLSSSSSLSHFIRFLFPFTPIPLSNVVISFHVFQHHQIALLQPKTETKCYLRTKHYYCY